MSGIEYQREILNKYKAREISYLDGTKLDKLKLDIRNWAGQHLNEIKLSGSRAKGTAISLASDYDYLISINNSCPCNLEEIYNSLYNELLRLKYKTRKQNVSIRVKINSLEIDITPAKKQNGYVNYHSIWLSKKQTWEQTNIQKHINDISLSGRCDNIKLLKIWRELHSLDFPSIYLEYLLKDVILKNKQQETLCLFDILTALAFNSNNPLDCRIIDPANSNNILSELLSSSEKNIIKQKARYSISQKYWRYIIW